MGDRPAPSLTINPMPESKRTASGVLGGIAGFVGLSAVAGVLVAATVTPAIALTGATASSAITMFDNLPSVLEIDKLMLPTTIWAMDYNTGQYSELAKFYDQDRSPVTSDQVAPVMNDAILSSEDPRFYQHGGVDLIGTTRAVLQNAQGGGSTQGGSTISQQYVKNILVQRCERDAKATETLTYDEVLANCWTQATTASGNDGIQRKLQEMRYAIALEKKYSKQEILLGYLNIANFGGRTYGIDAAARYYFGASASTLTLSQAATLAGMVQNPNAYRIDQPDGSFYNPSTDTMTNSAADGYADTTTRRNYVLGRMLDDGKITQEQYDAAYAEPITPNITQSTTGCAAAGGAAYYCQYVKNIILTDPAFGAEADDRLKTLQRGGLNIYTTLDRRLQGTAEQAMAEWTPTSVEGMVDASTGKFGAAVVNLEATTGRVLAIGQNTRFSEDASTEADPNFSSLVYAADSKYGRSDGFPVGSTFKVFTLIDWLEKGKSLNDTVDGRLRTIPRVTNSCEGDWVNTKSERVANFGGGGGYVGTPMQFTRDSLNTGYTAMASQLDLCDIEKVATKMGVAQGSGDPVQVDTLFSILGSNNVSPMAMAGAYATIANNGVYCQPKAIDKVTDSDGVDMPQYVPQTTCTQVLEPNIAATAAYALAGVMNNGTGTASNPFDGTPVLGKTGTHQQWQTWMVESSTAVATAVWVGNSTGEGDIFNRYFNGTQMSNLRHRIANAVQSNADVFYPGGDFAAPDQALLRRTLKDLPDVRGQAVAQATQTLTDAGFDVTVGAPVDSAEAEGIVAQQDPGAGQVASGTTVTIYPSTGQGVAVPDVTGRQLTRAVADLRSAGFGNVQPGRCTEDAANGDPQGRVTATNPTPGTVTNRNAAVTVDYTARDCTP